MENVKDYTVGAILGFKFKILSKYENVSVGLWETLPLEDPDNKEERKEKIKMIFKELEDGIVEEMADMESKAEKIKQKM